MCFQSLTGCQLDSYLAQCLRPFFADADQADADTDEAETVEEDASVLGLDQEDAQSFDVSDTDEQQK